MARNRKSRPRGAKWPDGFGGNSRTTRRAGTKSRLRRSTRAKSGGRR